MNQNQNETLRYFANEHYATTPELKPAKVVNSNVNYTNLDNKNIQQHYYNIERKSHNTHFYSRGQWVCIDLLEV